MAAQESLGTVATTKAAYNRAIDLKVATPQMIINYAAYLEDKGYFEDSFKVTPASAVVVDIVVVAVVVAAAAVRCVSAVSQCLLMSCTSYNTTCL